MDGVCHVRGGAHQGGVLGVDAEFAADDTVIGVQPHARDQFVTLLVALPLTALVVHQEAHVVPLSAANRGGADDAMRRQQFNHQVAARAARLKQGAAAQYVPGCGVERGWSWA